MNSKKQSEKKTTPKIARVYLRVSTDEQDLTRQESLIANARREGYYVAGVYKEKASGAIAARPELLRMIGDLQPGDVVIAERIDRISRLPLPEAEKLIGAIRAKGARLAIPGIVDLSEILAGSSGVAKVVLESTQEMLLRVALQMARDDYELRRERQKQGIALARAAGKYKGGKKNVALHEKIIALRDKKVSITETARLLNCGISTVKYVWKEEKQRKTGKSVNS
jgi:DNA invertase Pin-like site-specific DNA recombinase